jgi:N-acetylglutamate synthase-like GNAT family acetyltransferase
MLIRIATLDDLPKILELHRKFFGDDFLFPNLDKNLLMNSWVVFEGDELIAWSCIRLIPEMIAVTNQSAHALKRTDALSKLLMASAADMKAKNFEQIHCWIDERAMNWRKMLEKVGFKICSGIAYFINL